LQSGGGGVAESAGTVGKDISALQWGILKALHGGVAGVADNWKRHICFAVGDKEGVAGG
jgi:hypothetical protein